MKVASGLRGAGESLWLLWTMDSGRGLATCANGSSSNCATLYHGDAYLSMLSDFALTKWAHLCYILNKPAIASCKMYEQSVAFSPGWIQDRV